MKTLILSTPSGWFKKATFFAVFSLICVGALGSEQVHAQGSTSAPLAKKPITGIYQEFLGTYFTQKALIESQGDKFEVQSKISQWAKGDPEDRGSYDRGAEWGDIIDNMVDLYQLFFSHFFDCIEPMVVGICIKITIYGIYFDLFWEYYLPEQMVENVDQPFRSGFIPKFVQEMMRDYEDDPGSSASHYNWVAEEALTSIRTAKHIANNTNTFYFERPEQDADDQMEENEDVVDLFHDDSRNLHTTEYSDWQEGNYYHKQPTRQRNPNARLEGAIYNEYHALPTFFESFLGRVLPFSCHNPRSPGYWCSDWPFMKLPAQYSWFSYFVSPLEMFEIYGVPSFGGKGKGGTGFMGGFPYTITGHNMNGGLVSGLGGGGGGDLSMPGTPLDLLLQDPLSSKFNLRLIASPGFGVLNGNRGAFVPFTNQVANQLYPQAAAAVGTIRGLKVASAFEAGSFYQTNWRKSDKYHDKFQWFASKEMREVTDGECKVIEDPDLITRLTDWSKANKVTDTEEDNHQWNVLVHWKYFRCCPPGYDPFIVWSGDNKQIKD